jgi:EAL domain-containing protein (putative c-di-GMP-specific phosphodiesterase class I)
MERAAQHIYTQYIESTEHEAANKSIYDEARAHASDRLKDLIREGMETEAEATMIEAMAGGHMQGFIEGFMYASKLWAETTAEEWNRDPDQAPGPMTKDGPSDAPEWPQNDEKSMSDTRPRPKEGQGEAMVKRGGHPESRGHPHRS